MQGSKYLITLKGFQQNLNIAEISNKISKLMQTKPKTRNNQNQNNIRLKSSSMEINTRAIPDNK